MNHQPRRAAAGSGATNLNRHWQSLRFVFFLSDVSCRTAQPLTCCPFHAPVRYSLFFIRANTVRLLLLGGARVNVPIFIYLLACQFHRAMSLQLCGFLRKEKRVGFISGFVERWFVVSKDNHFEYYADSSAAAPSDRFPLAAIASVQQDEESFDILITASHRTFRLRAETKADLDRWVAGLRDAIMAAVPMRAASTLEHSHVALAPLHTLKPRSAAPCLSPTRPRDVRAVSRPLDDKFALPAATASASAVVPSRPPPPATAAPQLPSTSLATSHSPFALKTEVGVLHASYIPAPVRAKSPPPPSTPAPPLPPVFAPSVQSPRGHVASLDSHVRNGKHSVNSPPPGAATSQRTDAVHQTASNAITMVAANIPTMPIATGVEADRNWLDDNFDD